MDLGMAIYVVLCIALGLMGLETVKTVEWKTVELPNGAVTKQGTPLRVNCPTCNGRSVIDCDYCSGGIDPRFSR